MDIRSVVNKYGIPMTEIAEKMGVSKSYISQLVSGKPEPTLRKLQELANIIGCNRWEFFADEIMADGATVVREHLQETVSVKKKKDILPLANELPFNEGSHDGQKVEEQKVLRFEYDCPHCGGSVKVSIEKS